MIPLSPPRRPARLSGPTMGTWSGSLVMSMEEDVVDSDGVAVLKSASMDVEDPSSGRQSVSDRGD